MSAPQNLLDALNGLQSDQDDVTAKTTAKANTAAALLAAQTADVNAAHDLTASEAKLAADLAAFEGQLNSTYGPPVAPVAPPAS
jgi:hypothetical protein